MKKITTMVPVFMLVLLFAVSSYAAGMGSSADAAKNLSEDKLLGLTVFNKDGNQIGTISEVHKDAAGDGIGYVIVSSTGMEQHAVPLTALEINADQQRADLAVEEDKLLNAPNKTADMSDEEFRTRIDEHYGVGPAFEKSGDAPTGADMNEPTHLNEQQTQRERHEGTKQ